MLYKQLQKLIHTKQSIIAMLQRGYRDAKTCSGCSSDALCGETIYRIRLSPDVKNKRPRVYSPDRLHGGSLQLPTFTLQFGITDIPYLHV